MNVDDILTAARERISDPSRWGQGRAGLTTPPEGKECVVLAVDRAGHDLGSLYHAVRHALFLLKRELPDPNKTLTQYNDLATTRHEDVLALFDRAIAKCSS